jgi:hypothetical protein
LKIVAFLLCRDILKFFHSKNLEIAVKFDYFEYFQPRPHLSPSISAQYEAGLGKIPKSRENRKSTKIEGDYFKIFSSYGMIWKSDLN